LDSERIGEIINHATKLLAEVLKEVLSGENQKPEVNNEKESDSTDSDN
jgi:hypothetical protein